MAAKRTVQCKNHGCHRTAQSASVEDSFGWVLWRQRLDVYDFCSLNCALHYLLVEQGPLQDTPAEQLIFQQAADVLKKRREKPTPKAIETNYRGYRFRSRLEARWAVFFDALGVEWEYEKEGFELGDGIRYLPDFWLPKQSLWVEIKGQKPTKAEEEKARRLAKVTGYTVFIVTGLPSETPDLPYALYFEEGYDEDHTWCLCSICGAFGHRYSTGGGGVYLPCRHNTDKSCPEAAYEAARQARFEFGEMPSLPMSLRSPISPAPVFTSPPSPKRVVSQADLATPKVTSSLSGLPSGAIEECWPRILQACRTKSPRLAALLHSVTALDFRQTDTSKSECTASTTLDFIARKLAEPAANNIFKWALEEVLVCKFNVRVGLDLDAQGGAR